MEKYLPKVGEKLYLRQYTGSYYVDLVRRPYTVVSVTSTNVFVQKCELVFNGPRYYDTMPDEIKADPNGEILKLSYSEKYKRWQYNSYSGDAYPLSAVFGKWEFFPYLD